MKNVICFLFGHKVLKNKCIRCGCEFGVPKFRNAPPPPKYTKHVREILKAKKRGCV